MIDPRSRAWCIFWGVCSCTAPWNPSGLMEFARPHSLRTHRNISYGRGSGTRPLTVSLIGRWFGHRVEPKHRSCTLTREVLGRLRPQYKEKGPLLKQMRPSKKTSSRRVLGDRESRDGNFGAPSRNRGTFRPFRLRSTLSIRSGHCLSRPDTVLRHNITVSQSQNIEPTDMTGQLPWTMRSHKRCGRLLEAWDRRPLSWTSRWRCVREASTATWCEPTRPCRFPNTRESRHRRIQALSLRGSCSEAWRSPRSSARTLRSLGTVWLSSTYQFPRWTRQPEDATGRMRASASGDMIPDVLDQETKLCCSHLCRGVTVRWADTRCALTTLHSGVQFDFDSRVDGTPRRRCSATDRVPPLSYRSSGWPACSPGFCARATSEIGLVRFSSGGHNTPLGSQALNCSLERNSICMLSCLSGAGAAQQSAATCRKQPWQIPQGRHKRSLAGRQLYPLVLSRPVRHSCRSFRPRSTKFEQWSRIAFEAKGSLYITFGRSWRISRVPPSVRRLRATGSPPAVGGSTERRVVVLH